MIKTLIQKIVYQNKKTNVDIQFLKDEISRISSLKEKHLAVCIENTGSSFLGIKNATFNLFPKNTLVLPAYYSEIK